MLVLLWICCATVATAVEQYVPSEVTLFYNLEYFEFIHYVASVLQLCRDQETFGGGSARKSFFILQTWLANQFSCCSDDFIAEQFLLIPVGDRCSQPYSGSPDMRPFGL